MITLVSSHIVAEWIYKTHVRDFTSPIPVVCIVLQSINQHHSIIQVIPMWLFISKVYYWWDLLDYKL